MDKIKRLLAPQQSYEALDDDSPPPGPDRRRQQDDIPPFSWLVYGIFLLLGGITLLPWSSLMTANPYLQTRFKSSPAILRNFQPSELIIGTVTNLGSVLVLAKLQAHASYPKRIVSSLLINVVAFTLLAISTRVFLGVSAGVYLAFLLVIVLATSVATGFIQNGSFAYVADYKRPEYMQSIMFGQAVAGVLPPIAQIGLVLSTSKAPGESSSESAFAYFLTATGACLVTLLAFFFLLSQGPPKAMRTVVDDFADVEAEEEEESAGDLNHIKISAHETSVPLLYLAKRLVFPAAAVFVTFAVTMIFPVYTQQITTTNPEPPPVLRDAAFIPLALLVWNSGDLIGRLIPLSFRLSLASRPKILLVMAIARVVFIPMYHLCNIQGASSSSLMDTTIRGGAMPDVFYLLVVQLPFGLSNGYIGSCCMMGAGNFVGESEREAAGGFMGLVLVSGLAVGSLCSFFVGNG